jgi:hypothetical protein
MLTLDRGFINLRLINTATNSGDFAEPLIKELQPMQELFADRNGFLWHKHHCV